MTKTTDHRASFQGIVIAVLALIVLIEGCVLSALWPHTIMAEARSQLVQDALIKRGMFP